MLKVKGLFGLKAGASFILEYSSRLHLHMPCWSTSEHDNRGMDEVKCLMRGGKKIFPNTHRLLIVCRRWEGPVLKANWLIAPATRLPLRKACEWGRKRLPIMKRRCLPFLVATTTWKVCLSGFTTWRYPGMMAILWSGNKGSLNKAFIPLSSCRPDLFNHESHGYRDLKQARKLSKSFKWRKGSKS